MADDQPRVIYRMRRREPAAAQCGQRGDRSARIPGKRVRAEGVPKVANDDAVIVDTQAPRERLQRLYRSHVGHRACTCVEGLLPIPGSAPWRLPSGVAMLVQCIPASEADLVRHVDERA